MAERLLAEFGVMCLERIPEAESATHDEFKKRLESNEKDAGCDNCTHSGHEALTSAVAINTKSSATKPSHIRNC